MYESEVQKKIHLLFKEVYECFSRKDFIERNKEIESILATNIVCMDKSIIKKGKDFACFKKYMKIFIDSYFFRLRDSTLKAIYLKGKQLKKEGLGGHDLIMYSMLIKEEKRRLPIIRTGIYQKEGCLYLIKDSKPKEENNNMIVSAYVLKENHKERYKIEGLEVIKVRVDDFREWNYLYSHHAEECKNEKQIKGKYVEKAVSKPKLKEKVIINL